MNNHPDTYDIVEDQFASNGTLRYYFIRQEKKDIIKLIQYQYKGTPYNIVFVSKNN